MSKPETGTCMSDICPEVKPKADCAPGDTDPQASPWRSLSTLASHRAAVWPVPQRGGESEAGVNPVTLSQTSWGHTAPLHLPPPPPLPASLSGLGVCPSAWDCPGAAGFGRSLHLKAEDVPDAWCFSGSANPAVSPLQQSLRLQGQADLGENCLALPCLHPLKGPRWLQGVGRIGS